MANSTELVSPKQAARALGVSESSLKRWCDQGLIPAVRTAGGHRKVAIAHVLEFCRQHHRTLSSPEVLALPPSSEQAVLGLRRGKERLLDALLSGDDQLVRQIVVDLYLARHPLATIFDDVIAAAFHDIGERWACAAAEVYQERRAIECMHRILSELRRLQPGPFGPAVAIGATIEGDPYSLALAMADLVLRDAGFATDPLGTSIPAPSLVRAVVELRPQLFWLSVSHIAEADRFLSQFAVLAEACAAAGTALLVGGRALHADLRQHLNYSAYGDTMQNLQSFARAWHSSPGQSPAPGETARRVPAAGRAVRPRKRS